VFGRQQCFLSLYYILLLYRIVQTRSFYDNFALCLSFSSDVSSLADGKTQWYATVNLFLWIYFWIAWLFQNIYKRNSLRIWDNIMIFLIFKGKQRKEIQKRNFLISAHLHDDMLQHLFSVDTPKCQRYIDISKSGLESDRRSNVFFQGEEIYRNDENPVFSLPSLSTEDTCPMVEYALHHKILTSLDYGAINIPHLKALNGLSKRSSTLIAIKIEKGESDECVLTADREQNIHQLVDGLAETYKITPIRRFGDTWIGSLGYCQEKIPNETSQDFVAFFHPMRKGKKAFPEVVLGEHKNNTSVSQTDQRKPKDTTIQNLEVKCLNSIDHSGPLMKDEESLISNSESRSELSEDYSMSDSSLSTNDSSECSDFVHHRIEEKKEMRIDKILKEQRRKRKKEKNHGTERDIGHNRTPQENNNKMVRNDSAQAEKKPRRKDNRTHDMNSICDILNSLRFCAELQLILQRFGVKMTAAVDYGHILGGFIGSPHFDFFGQEIRWILKAVSLNEFSRIFVCEGIRDLFSHKLRHGHEAFKLTSPEFQRVVCEYPWKKESYMSLIALSNSGKILDCLPKLGYYLLPKYHVKTVEELACLVLSSSWLSSFGSSVSYPFAASFDSGDAEQYSTNSGDVKAVSECALMEKSADLSIFPVEMKDLSSTTAYKYQLVEEMKDDDTILGDGRTWNRDLLLMYLESLFWYEDLGTEFKTTVYSRWSVDGNDNILENYSESELMTLMRLTENQLYDLVQKTCFPSLFDLLFMKSQYHHDINNHFLEKKKRNSIWVSSLSSFLNVVKEDQGVVLPKDTKRINGTEVNCRSDEVLEMYDAPVIEPPLWLVSVTDYLLS
jgi:hypothetical protein